VSASGREIDIAAGAMSTKISGVMAVNSKVMMGAGAASTKIAMTEISAQIVRISKALEILNLEISKVASGLVRCRRPGMSG
jgi:hypothetical protein